MQAIILAAGVGKRLGPVAGEAAPKCLLEFGGETLLDRHLRLLARFGLTTITIVTGYKHERIAAAIAATAQPIQLVHNPDFEDGSMVSLWCAREALRDGDEILLMDADVLYDPAIMASLVKAPRSDLFLFDGDFEAGDEPVKLCVKDGRLVEFRKRPAAADDCDRIGESVGFFRFSAATASVLAGQTESYVAADDRQAPHEEAIRDLLLAEPDRFDYIDVTGLPWIEIDFPADVSRAEHEILPLINDNRATTAASKPA